MNIGRLLNKAITALNEFDEYFKMDSIVFNNQPEIKKQYMQTTGNINCQRDTIIIVDVSVSMEEDDYNPTRLDGGISAGIEYINARAKYSDDRIAIVSFSDDAYIVLPLTKMNEKSKIISAMHSLDIEGGTDIAKGLQAAITIFKNSKNGNHLRNIILLTDGHGGNPTRTAGKLEDQYNAVIDVTGIGGSHKAVNEKLLREIATTDTSGFNHYCFIKDSKSLKNHYKELATGITWSGNDKITSI